jgi:hypothetical protein
VFESHRAHSLLSEAVALNHSKIILLVLCALCSIALLFLNMYISLIGIVVVITLAMSFGISASSQKIPDVVAKLTEDSKGIVLINRGTSQALDIRVALVPLNIEFTVPRLMEDESLLHPLALMIDQVKVIVTYRGESEGNVTRTFFLSPLAPDEDDLLRPMFPLFRWKRDP